MKYSYEPSSPVGPSHWKENYPNCGGEKQSPINIQTQTVKKIKNGNILLVTDFDTYPAKIQAYNSQYNVHFEFTYLNRPLLSGGPLQSTYSLQEMHFHFGTNKTGSEHLIDGKSDEGEMHLVFQNTLYNDSSEASENADGMAVLTRLLTRTKKTKQKMKANLYQFFSNVKEVNSTYEILAPNTFSLRDFYGNLKFDYYTYDGSLTTPGCSESVKFIIAKEKLKIRSESLTSFRKVRGYEDFIAPNYRPTQQIGDRDIFLYEY